MAVFIEYTDIENNNAGEPIKLTMDAEAFDIKVGFRLDEEEEGKEGKLKFGNVRCSSEKVLNFTILNNGTYSADFKFIMKKKEVRNVFTITPMEGTLDPKGGNSDVEVRFLAHRELK